MDETPKIQPFQDEPSLKVNHFLTGRGFIVGKSGSGKSNTTGRICEEILEHNLPLLIVDPDGEYMGLKEQYSILHVGGDEECDYQVGPEHGKRIVDLLLSQMVPVILDTSTYFEQEREHQVINSVLEPLFAREKKAKQPLPVIVEEMDNYCPQNGKPSTKPTMVKIASQGRKHGLGIIGVSQRSSYVDKDYVTQTNYRVWHKQKWDSDLKVVKDVIREDDYRDEVSDLRTGQALWNAEFDAPNRIVEVKQKQTVDLGETPDLEDFELPEFQGIDEDLIDDLKEITEERQEEQSRIEQLEQQLENVKGERDELRSELEKERRANDLAERLVNTLSRSSKSTTDDDGLEEEIESIREEKEDEIQSLKERLNKKDEEINEYQERLGEAEKKAEKWEKNKDVYDRIDDVREEIRMLAKITNTGLDGDKKAQQLQQRIHDLEAERDMLEKRVEELEENPSVLGEKFESRMDFLQDDLVQSQVSQAVTNTTLGEQHFQDALVYLVENGESTTKQVGELLDITRSNVGNVLRRLHEQKVLKRRKQGNKYKYDLNVDGIEEIKEHKAKKQRLREIREQEFGDTK